jgi:hypothetical protein
MDLNHLTRDADNLIRKVVSRYNQLYVPTGTISQVELDLMLDDLRKLYDTFKNIGQLNLSLQNSPVQPEVKVQSAVSTGPQPVAAAKPVFEEPLAKPSEPVQKQVEPQPETSLLSSGEPETKPEYKSDPESDISLPVETEEDFSIEQEAEPIPEKEVQPASAPAVIENSFTQKTETIATANPEPATLADKFNTGNKSLSETLALAQAQGADLVTGIGLNDKFSFISDLFGNNTTKYDEAIARINKAVNLDEANWILQKYHLPDWDQKAEVLQRLKDFVKRRFI